MIAAAALGLKALSFGLNGLVLAAMAQAESGSSRVSVILPVWREARVIESVLAALAPWREQGHEVIVVDGGSDDGTAERARDRCDRLLVSGRGRAAQMNAGAAAATGDILLFLHADTLLPAEALPELMAFASSRQHWGRFDVRLSGRRPLFRVIAWFMNQRSRLTGIATGDQAIFVRRATFEALQGFEEQPLMEDVELCSRLRLTSRPWCIQAPVITSSRRWEVHGDCRTIVLMLLLLWSYLRGDDPETLER